MALFISFYSQINFGHETTHLGTVKSNMFGHEIVNALLMFAIDVFTVKSILVATLSFISDALWADCGNYGNFPTF